MTRWTFVGKVTSLLFNMLSRMVITFLPRSKRLLISWWQSPCAVILEPKEIKSVTVSIVSPSICHGVMGKTRDLFKKIRDTKGTFHAKIGSIKNRNGMDLTEVEDIKKRWQEYTENCTKKIFMTQIITMV